MSFSLAAQTTQKQKFQPAFAAGYLFGANVSPHQFNYASGASFKGILQTDLRDASSVGILVGLNKYGETTFYPVGLTFNLKSKKESAAGFLLETGYAFGRSKIEDLNWRYDLEGSLFVTLGAKWSYTISECLTLQPSISATTHNSTLTYESEVGNSYSIVQDQVAFMVHLGLLFNK